MIKYPIRIYTNVSEKMKELLDAKAEVKGIKRAEHMREVLKKDLKENKR